MRHHYTIGLKILLGTLMPLTKLPPSHHTRGGGKGEKNDIKMLYHYYTTQFNFVNGFCRLTSTISKNIQDHCKFETKFQNTVSKEYHLYNIWKKFVLPIPAAMTALGFQYYIFWEFLLSYLTK